MLQCSLSRAGVAASLESPSGARLISFTDVIEIKGAAAAVAAKEKECKEAELAMLQASCSRPCFLPPSTQPCLLTSSPQATFGTIPSNGSRIKAPSPVSSLLSLTGTEGACSGNLSRSSTQHRQRLSQANCHQLPGQQRPRGSGGDSTRVPHQHFSCLFANVIPVVQWALAWLGAAARGLPSLCLRASKEAMFCSGPCGMSASRQLLPHGQGNTCIGHNAVARFSDRPLRRPDRPSAWRLCPASTVTATAASSSGGITKQKKKSA